VREVEPTKRRLLHRCFVHRRQRHPTRLTTCSPRPNRVKNDLSTQGFAARVAPMDDLPYAPIDHHTLRRRTTLSLSLGFAAPPTQR
jgi:hypothetical protein